MQMAEGVLLILLCGCFFVGKEQGSVFRLMWCFLLAEG